MDAIYKLYPQVVTVNGDVAISLSKTRTSLIATRLGIYAMRSLSFITW